LCVFSHNIRSGLIIHKQSASAQLPGPRSVSVECYRERRDQQVGNNCTECLCHPVNILRYSLVTAHQTPSDTTQLSAIDTKYNSHT